MLPQDFVRINFLRRYNLYKFFISVPKGTTWPTEADCPAHNFVMKKKNINAILQLSTDDGTTFEDTFFFFLDTRNPTSNDSCLFTPSVTDQYKVLEQFPGYDSGATLCDGAGDGRSKLFWVYKEDAGPDDFLFPAGEIDEFDPIPRFKNDPTVLVRLSNL